MMQNHVYNNFRMAFLSGLIVTNPPVGNRGVTATHSCDSLTGKAEVSQAARSQASRYSSERRARFSLRTLS